MLVRVWVETFTNRNFMSFECTKKCTNSRHFRRMGTTLKTCIIILLQNLPNQIWFQNKDNLIIYLYGNQILFIHPRIILINVIY